MSRACGATIVGPIFGLPIALKIQQTLVVIGIIPVAIKAFTSTERQNAGGLKFASEESALV